MILCLTKYEVSDIIKNVYEGGGSMKQEVDLINQKKLMSLKDVNGKVKEKRALDLFRFRTCCCDPRASK